MIETKLKENLADFKSPIKIVDTENQSELRFGGSSDSTGYLFKQKEVIDTVDLYYNSKFEKGQKDNQGYRKIFLNKVKFAQNVAEKQTDVDVANYNFIPDSQKDTNLVWLLKRQFIVWTRENDYGELLNDLNKDFSKYGTCVLRRQGSLIERIPLQKLKNSQDATSLKKAPEEGGYVMVEHDMSYYQMKQMPDWDMENVLRFKGTKKVYEMYCLYEEKYLDEDSESEEEVLGVAYICPELKRSDTNGGAVLFKERIKEVPFEEAHWDKQEGRWLGVGVVEDLFENQIATNMVENLRRKHLTWGAKKVFQSQGEAVVRNLNQEVADGTVLEVGNRGEISQVSMESRNLAEFREATERLDTNSEQRTFTFEVSTGQSLPSGTPFRLGVVLSQSAARHFDLKQEKFGLFLYRSFFSQLIPVFKKQSKEHIIAIANGEDGADFIKEALINYNADRKFNAKLLNDQIPSYRQIREKVAAELDRKPFMFVNLPDGIYKDIKFKMQLDITRQEEDTDATMATLVTLYQTMVQRNPNDPRADHILDQIISISGHNPNKVLGSNKEQPDSMLGVQNQRQGMAQQLQGLTQMQNAPVNG